MRVLFCLFLLGCDSGEPVMCVTDAAAMSCDDAESVVLYTLGDGQLGTFTACTTCTTGSLCMFKSGDTFVDGVCK